MFIEVMRNLNENGYDGKLFVEIKKLSSSFARNNLFENVTNINKKIKISILAFKKNFQESFPDETYWCEKFKENDIKVLTSGFHRDMCSKKL